MRRTVVVAAVLSWALLGCAAATGPAPKQLRGSDISGLYTLPDVELTSTSGTPAKLRPVGKKTILFFGYSSCPDVCSGIIADVVAAKRRIAPEASSQFDVVVVTTDPARDTPTVWKAYLDRFDPGIVGLTGAVEQVVDTGKAVGVDIAQGKKLPSGGYEVDHGTAVYVFGNDYRSLVVWTNGTAIGDMKNDLELIARQ